MESEEMNVKPEDTEQEEKEFDYLEEREELT